MEEKKGVIKFVFLALVGFLFFILLLIFVSGNVFEDKTQGDFNNGTYNFTFYNLNLQHHYENTKNSYKNRNYLNSFLYPFH